MIEYLKLIKSYSEKTMMKLLDGEVVFSKSYADYYKDIRACAYKIECFFGDVKDKHIGIIGKNDYEYMVFLAAIIFSRAVVVPLNYHESEDNLLSAIRKSDLDMLITCDEVQLKFEDKSPIVVKKECFFEDILEEKELLDFNNDEKNRTAMIIFTSGSTSLAKGVELTVGGFFSKMKKYYIPESKEHFANKQIETNGYVNTPFYHLSGIMPWLGWTEYGITFCISRDSKNILFDLEHNRIEYAAVSPAVMNLWSKCLLSKKKERLGGVKYIYTGGAKLNADMTKLFSAEGITIIQIYGMTETGGDVTINFDMLYHGDSVGKIVDGVELHFIDGEICVKTETDMKGYYKNPEDTDNIMKNDLIHTGDLGYIDNDGYVYITGRKKNLIILSGGENVSPEELETRLYKCPQIVECKVYENNDRICADIYAPNMKESDLECFISELNRSLPIYKRIYKSNYLKTEIEKTATGKIRR